MRKKDLRTPDYLQHILDAIERIRTYTASLSRESFEATPMAVDAVVRNIAIMGKAARNITRDDPDFAAAHPDIPWEAMYGMRNHSDAQVLCRGRRHCLEHREVIFART